MFWQGAARQGAHFAIRLISAGPEKESRKWKQMREERGCRVENKKKGRKRIC